MRGSILSPILLGACATASYSGDLMAEMRALEAARGAAVRAYDEVALSRIYAEDFQGVSVHGAPVARAELFAVFEAARDNAALFQGSTSEVLTARREGNVVVVTGRRHFGGNNSIYTHVFRWRDDHWELMAASATLIPN